MGDYYDHYLKKMYYWYQMYSKSLLKLAYELLYYELDPCHYFSSPGLIWDAMLKMTGVQLEKNIRH